MNIVHIDSMQRYSSTVATMKEEISGLYSLQGPNVAVVAHTNGKRGLGSESVSHVFNNAGIRYTLPSAASALVTGFFFENQWGSYWGSVHASYATYEEQVFFFNSASEILTKLVFDTAGVKLYKGNATLVASGGNGFVEDVAYHIEIAYYAAATGGRVVVKVDGNVAIDFTGDTSGGRTTVDLGSFMLAGTNSTYKETGIFSELWVGDASTEGANVATAMLGPTHIASAPVDSDVSVAWTPRSGAANHFGELDEAQSDGDTSYVETTAAGTRNVHGAIGTLPSGVTVKAVMPYALAKLTEAGTGAVKLGVKSGLSEALPASADNLPTAYRRVNGIIQTTDPATAAAWTKAGAEAVEVVVESA